jgi:PIN domain nuclease of toxin-antitoxin system
MSKYVLDASAVLALLNQETGHDKVEAVLSDSVMSAVNLCEVMSKLIEAGLSEEEARESIDLLNVEIISFDADHAHRAAALRPTTKKLGLSLGDRSCLALGLAQRHTVITAEREWAKLRIGIKIELIR